MTQQQEPDAAESPGWDAINAATARIYGDEQPKHVGTIMPWHLGGPDPLDGISAWKRLEPIPHWHFVTYGLTELYAKESEYVEISGWGFELTFRLACDAGEENPPIWVFSLLQNLARYVVQSGNIFEDGHWMNLNGPIALETETLIRSIAFVHDPELPRIDTPNGKIIFLQVVGLTLDEETAVKRWQTRKVLDIFLPHMPLWVTDLSRASLLDDPDIREQVETGSRCEGSATGSVFTEVLTWKIEPRLLRSNLTTITLGAGQVDDIMSLLPLRLPFGYDQRIVSRDARVVLAPGESDAVHAGEGELRVQLTTATAEALARTLQPRAGTYATPGFDTLRWEVRQTFIRDANGNVVQTIG